jgi:hypothetical protein
MKDNYHTYINSRKADKTYIFKNKQKIKTPVFEHLEDSTLYAIIHPYELSDYINSMMLDGENKKK